MGDPLYHDQSGEKRLIADTRVAAILMRVQWLKLASGLVALALIAAVWIVWRWPG